MKKVCEQCPLPNKSKEMCIKRQCHNADMPPPPPPLPVPESKWHMEEKDIIGDNEIKILITSMFEDRQKNQTGDFYAQIIELKDKAKEPGHFGSYVTKGQYYKFTLHEDKEEGYKSMILWEIYEESTDRFHREGSTGAQFLLYWFKESGFGFDLDS
jgi:hypothetical protein